MLDTKETLVAPARQQFSVEPTIKSLIPFCKGRQGIEVNQNNLFGSRKEQDPHFELANPLEKARCMHEFHIGKGVDYSYGGFLEIRSRMFADTSYISQARCYVHLGVDINVPAWEEVRFPSSAQVLRVVHDSDTEIGWGTRVDLAHPTQPIVFIFGHLGPDVTVYEGEILPACGKKIGRIGEPKVNGGCDPHLHLQVMSREKYDHLVNRGELDGYAQEADLPEIRRNYFDPLKAVLDLRPTSWPIPEGFKLDDGNCLIGRR